MSIYDLVDVLCKCNYTRAGSRYGPIPPPFDSYIMQIQPILGLYQPIPPPPPISTLGPLFLQILDPALNYTTHILKGNGFIDLKEAWQYFVQLLHLH